MQVCFDCLFLLKWDIISVGKCTVSLSPIIYKQVLQTFSSNLNCQKLLTTWGHWGGWSLSQLSHSEPVSSPTETKRRATDNHMLSQPHLRLILDRDLTFHASFWEERPPLVQGRLANSKTSALWIIMNIWKWLKLAVISRLFAAVTFADFLIYITVCHISVYHTVSLWYHLDMPVITGSVSRYDQMVSNSFNSPSY